MMNLPYIVDGDFVLTQTDPIINYLGRSACAMLVHVLPHYTVLIAMCCVPIPISSHIALCVAWIVTLCLRVRASRKYGLHGSTTAETAIIEQVLAQVSDVFSLPSRADLVQGSGVSPALTPPPGAAHRRRICATTP